MQNDDVLVIFLPEKFFRACEYGGLVLQLNFRTCTQIIICF
jgi:hypothetical protein